MLIQFMSKKILTIEDDSFLRGLEMKKLAKDGYEVISASTGDEAMKSIVLGGYSLILLDLMLPGVDGFEVLKTIRSTPVTQNTPVIVFSNLAEEKDVEKARGLGASDFMIKSNFTLEELSAKIKEMAL